MKQVHARRSDEHSLQTETVAKCETPTSTRQNVRQLLSARDFTERFVSWCNDNGLRGAQDLSLLATLSGEFADYANVYPICVGDLAGQMVRLGIKKKRRHMQPYERGFAQAKRRCSGRRPPTTVYFILPPRFPFRATDNPDGWDRRQGRLFEKAEP